MVVWLVGMSGAGKTTIGRELHAQWAQRSKDVVLLDGDAVRRASGADQSPADYTLVGRRRNAERMTELCLEHDRDGRDVVCCILSVFEDMRRANRSLFSSYFEVYVRADICVLEARDTKGLYAGAREGRTPNVVGIDIPFEAPQRPDLVVDTNPGGPRPELAATAILQMISYAKAA